MIVEKSKLLLAAELEWRWNANSRNVLQDSTAILVWLNIFGIKIKVTAVESVVCVKFFVIKYYVQTSATGITF